MRATITVIGMDPTPIWRPTARILVLDPLGRVLLFSGPDPHGVTYWFTPGGGVHRGETLPRAAVRELAEETGFACTEAELGPVVATCAGLWPEPDRRGRRVFAADSFFFLRVPHPDIDTDGQEDGERAYITGHRWWPADDIRAAAEEVWPIGLADLVDRLLCGDIPERPARLPWS